MSFEKYQIARKAANRLRKIDRAGRFVSERHAGQFVFLVSEKLRAAQRESDRLSKGVAAASWSGRSPL